MTSLSNDQEEQIIDALVGLGYLPGIEAPTRIAIHTALPELTNAGVNDVLNKLVDEGRIVKQTELGGSLTEGNDMTFARVRWIRPDGDE